MSVKKRVTVPVGCAITAQLWRLSRQANGPPLPAGQWVGRCGPLARQLWVAVIPFATRSSSIDVSGGQWNPLGRAGRTR